MYEIPLTRGLYAWVDSEDYGMLRLHKWHATNNGYAATRSGGRILLMHRVILNAPAHLQVDHINGCKTDNRRENLRLATSRQNRMNQRPRCDNKSGFKGVLWIPRIKRWRAQIRAKNANLSLGHFKTPEEAARAYNDAAREYFGEFAYLNEV